jgi:hypothetical protein
MDAFGPTVRQRGEVENRIGPRVRRHLADYVAQLQPTFAVESPASSVAFRSRYDSTTRRDANMPRRGGRIDVWSHPMGVWERQILGECALTPAGGSHWILGGSRLRAGGGDLTARCGRLAEQCDDLCGRSSQVCACASHLIDASRDVNRCDQSSLRTVRSSQRSDR